MSGSARWAASCLRSAASRSISGRGLAVPEGEVKLARKLEKWTAEHGVVLLHDRRMPTSRGNIDHIAIGPLLGRISQNRQSVESEKSCKSAPRPNGDFPQIAGKA